MRLCAFAFIKEDRCVANHDGSGGETKTGAETKSNRAEGADGRPFKAGIAVGIGSAAIVAALLYARTGRGKKK
jgi:hypothetical protein